MAYKIEANLCPQEPILLSSTKQPSSSLKYNSHGEIINMGSFSRLVGICVLTASLTTQALHFDIELNDDRNGGPSVLASPDIYDDTQQLMCV